MKLFFKSGILIKNSRSLELLSKTKTLALSKNGVITSDHESIDKIINYSENSDEQLLIIAGSMLQDTNSNISKTLVDTIKHQNLKLIKIKHAFVNEKYLSATLKNQHIIVGSEKLLEDKSIELPKKLNVDSIDSSTLFIVIDGAVAGLIIFKETLSKQNFKAIEYLKSKIKNTIIISGDNENSIKKIANQFKIKRYYFNQSIKEKLNILQNQKLKPVTLVSYKDTDKSLYQRANCVVEITDDLKLVLDYQQDFTIFKQDLGQLSNSYKIARKYHSILKYFITMSLALNLLLIIIVIKFNINLLVSSFIQLAEIILFAAIIILFDLKTNQ